MRLVLASTSPYRRELLARLGLDFDTLAPEVDETLAAGEPPEQAVVRLAAAKAGAGAEQAPAAVIIASDQLASLNGRALGKPGNFEAATHQLTAMSGQEILYCTALAVQAPDDTAATYLDLSRVYLRELSPLEIERYLTTEQPFDCAGALKLERLGIGLCERIETSDPTALIGLPLIATAQLLREQGFAIP
ncbi:MAG: Maf family protein [Gammaproteobacteria bacterium]